MATYDAGPGVSGSYGTRTGGAQSRTGGATGGVGGYAAGGAVTMASAPYIPTSFDLLALAQAGAGQRFPLGTRVISAVEGVLLAENEEALIL